MKIYVIGPKNYANWIEGVMVNSIRESDLVLFTGGEDVDPSLYKEKKHPTTSSNLTRDIYETGLFKKALFLNKKMLGICRGSQFLCVMAGGKLIQDQQNSYIHELTTFDNKEKLHVISTHHQAQYPWNISQNDFKILAWTDNVLGHHENGDSKELEIPENKECEVVLYKKINALAMQTHPEMMFETKLQPAVDWCNNILKLFMQDKI